MPLPATTRNKQATIEEMIARVAGGQLPFRAVEAIGLPWNTWVNWLNADPALKERFQRARDDLHDRLAEQAMDIAEGVERRDLIDLLEIDPVAGAKRARQLAVLGDAVARDKLRVDTRLRILAKWDPSRYGDKQIHEHQGGVELHDNRQQVLVAASIAASLRAVKRDGEIVDVEFEPVPDPVQEAIEASIDDGLDLL